MAILETVDVVVVGTGFGGAIPGYHLAEAGAEVVFLERGPRLAPEEFTHDLQLGTYTRLVDLIRGDGVDVIAGNCVGGSSVIYFAASLRAPAFVFDREGSSGQRLWPASLSRETLDPWYDRVEERLPVHEQPWDEVGYAGGVWAAACDAAGRTCNPTPLAVDYGRCTNCNWMLNGCRFDAKRSMLLNYLPWAEEAGAEIRPLHEVQAVRPAVTPGYRYAVDYLEIDGDDYRVTRGGGTIEARIVVLAAGAMGTPVILQRSEGHLGALPAAVGRHFSPNGDRVTLTVLDEDRVGADLGLGRDSETAYEGYPIGKPIGTTSYDRLDAALPEFERYALQQIYFPPITNLLAEDGTGEPPRWFGIDKRDQTLRWRSWLTVLAMTEDDNEGSFGTPPPTGNFVRLASSASLSTLSYQPNEHTRRGWELSDADVRSIVERGGLGQHRRWEQTENTLSAHPLSTCRIGDDPDLSACDDTHELRGHTGLFVTDGSAVPTALCVNPSLTIAAMAERAASLIVERAPELGVDVDPDARPGGRERPPPESEVPGSSPPPSASASPSDDPRPPLPATGPALPMVTGAAAIAGAAALHRAGADPIHRVPAAERSLDPSTRDEGEHTCDTADAETRC
jgi:enediyne biosynthesis protein E9